MHIIFQAATSTFLTPSILALAPALKHLPYGACSRTQTPSIWGLAPAFK